MLTADLAMSWRRGRTIEPKYVNPADPEHLRTASGLVAITGDHRGRSRGELDRAYEEFIGSGTDYRVIRGMIKLLTDRCAFETSSPVDPVELRRAVFTAARARHPVAATPGARDAVLEEVAAGLGVTAGAVAAGLYADLASSQLLAGFDDLSPAELLDLYNLAQAQALLYRAVAMELTVRPQPPAGYRRLFDAIKAYRLVYAIEGDARSGYEVRLDGPVSMFHRSQKYGVQMAVFLPALLVCEGWRMRAEIDARPRGTAWYELASEQDRLRAPEAARPDERRPAIEKLLSGLSSGEWVAAPSGEVVDLGAAAFVPDLTVRHAGGAEVHVEVLGFWTPKYLEGRLEELARGGFERYLLVVSDELRASRDPLAEPPPRVVVYKSAPDLRAVRAALESVREAYAGRRRRG